MSVKIFPGDAFLAKPFLPSILVDTVWRLQRKQLQERKL